MFSLNVVTGGLYSIGYDYTLTLIHFRKHLRGINTRVLLLFQGSSLHVRWKPIRRVSSVTIIFTLESLRVEDVTLIDWGLANGRVVDDKIVRV